MSAVRRYAAVLGRPPFVERAASNDRDIKVWGFPPLKRSFWRGLIAEAHDVTVYATAGMSAYEMAVPEPVQNIYVANVELMALCDGQITAGTAGEEDVVAALLLLVAEYVVDQRIFIGAGHTLDFQESLGLNTQMSAFLFTPPEGVDEKRLCRCTDARALLNVVPITAAELDLARRSGVEALVARFESAGVRPVFDYLRGSAV